MRRFPMILAMVALSACAQQQTAGSAPSPDGTVMATTPAREELIAAERAFAALSMASGVRSAFLAYLADDAVLFIPRASLGRPFFEQQQSDGSRLEWAPIYAEVSAAGDLGFTTGPYEARANPAVDSVTAYGNFVSVWKRSLATDAWKVALDLGTTNDRPPAARRLRAARGATVRSRMAAAHAADTGGSSGIGDRTLGPLGADSLFSARAAADGTADAMLAVGASDLRLHREDREPIVGRDAAVAALRRAGERFAWYPSVGVEAQSSDLGYTYGTYGGAEPGAPEQGAYVRVWRRGAEGRWRLALDITNPFPP